jgi:Flp pilus assembly protein TadG
MKLHRVSFVRSILDDKRGQTIVMLAIGMATFIVLVGVSIDLGHVYYAIQQLQASTNAAALAGASGLPDTDTAAAYVVAYSSVQKQGRLRARTPVQA